MEQTPNYRPISVLPLFSKIYEKCVARRLISYVDKFCLLSLNQYGFRHGKSTSDAIFQLTEFLYDCLNRGDYAACIFIDLEKAFDTVNHSILLQKLELYGIRGPSLKWFTSYLSERKQCARISEYISPPLPILTDVPQGSVLGPLFFSSI